MTNKPTIDTLVQDIYNLFNTNHKVKPENAQALANDLTRILTERFANMGEERRTLRLSMIGKPLCEIWYHVKGYPKEPIPPYTKIKFLYGDILEALLLFLARESGHLVEEEQKEIMLDGVKGHQDARIDGVLIDVKSASTYGFKKFKEGTIVEDDPFGYLEQLAAYMSDKNDKFAGWLAIDKTLGHLTLCLLDDLQFPDVTEKISQIKEALAKDSPPPRCFDAEPEGKKGNLVLGTTCSYCSFKQTCWKDANDGQGIRTFLYAKGPKYLVKIVEMPKVPEINDATQNTQQQNPTEVETHLN